MFTMKDLEELEKVDMARDTFKNDYEKLSYLINEQIKLKDIMNMNVDEFVALKDGYKTVQSFLDYLDAMTDTINALNHKIMKLEQELEVKKMMEVEV